MVRGKEKEGKKDKKGEKKVHSHDNLYGFCLAWTIAKRRTKKKNKEGTRAEKGNNENTTFASQEQSWHIISLRGAELNQKARTQKKKDEDDRFP